MKRRILTGIPGLDDMLGGGFPEGSSIVLSAPPGLGKSNLAMQYLYNGVKDYDEAGIYLTIEETTEDVEEYASAFGWDFKKYEANGKLTVLGREIFGGTDMDLGMDFGILRDIIDDNNVKRVVLDSITLFDYLFRDETSRRLHIVRFLELMKKSGCTTLITAEQHKTFPAMEYGPEHFLSDGLIVLFWSKYKANNERCIWITKMRGAKINSDIRPMKITNEGVVVYPSEVPFTLMKQGGSDGI